MTLTKEQLDELARLEKQATPGPWRASNPAWLVGSDGSSLSGGSDDADLIAALRNAAPALIEAARFSCDLNMSDEEARRTLTDAGIDADEAWSRLKPRLDALEELCNERDALRVKLAAAEKVVEAARDLQRTVTVDNWPDAARNWRRVVDDYDKAVKP